MSCGFRGQKFDFFYRAEFCHLGRWVSLLCWLVMDDCEGLQGPNDAIQRISCRIQWLPRPLEVLIFLDSCSNFLCFFRLAGLWVCSRCSIWWWRGRGRSPCNWHRGRRACFLRFILLGILNWYFFAPSPGYLNLTFIAAKEAQEQD